MSGGAIVGAFGDPDRDPLSRGMARLAHSVPYVLLAYLAYCALRWFGIINPSLWVTLAVMLGPLALVVLVGGLHQEIGRLCLWCMQKVPADAGIRVRRWLPLLWLAHRIGGWRLPGAMLALAVLGGIVGGLAGLAPPHTAWLAAPSQLLLIAALWGQWKHHRYRPWCPYCEDWGDGGMREPSPDPSIDARKVA